VKNLQVTDGKASFTIELTTPACPVREQLKSDAERAVRGVQGIKEVEIKMTSNVRGHGNQNQRKLLPEVKNIIPVASGKGGVGKSTVSANIALALQKTGAAVGLLDADIYGPSIPLLLGIDEEARASERNTILPIMKYGMKVMSMGFFAQQNQAIIWRGPMLSKMMEQFLGVVEWGALDYLVVDLPPGTGDIQLSLCQSIPLTGAVIVTTPQDVAMNVARKALLMFNQLKTPILGIVENMSYYVCPECGHRERIFGEGGGVKASEEFGVPFLGKVPLTTRIREKSDAGSPVVLSSPDTEDAKAFESIAENLAAQISIRNLAEADNEVKITF
jgi:ATP-binding protein involved in chromosome partitioning